MLLLAPAACLQQQHMDIVPPLCLWTYVLLPCKRYNLPALQRLGEQQCIGWV